MTQTQSLFRSFFDMNGTASRKRGWLVFGTTLAAIVAVALVAESAPDLRRWIVPLLGPLVAVQAITMVQRLHDAGRSGYWSLLTVVPLFGFFASIIINTLRPRPGVFVAPGHKWAQGLGYLLLAGFAALTIARAFVGVYWIPSGSMKPTLLVGDYLLVPDISASDVQRGDVLVFRHPINGSDFVKRLIGLPGDTVQMQGGKIILNGAELPQVAAGAFSELYDQQGPNGTWPRCQNAPVVIGQPCFKAMARETLPDGRSYDVLDIDTGGAADDTEVFTVPEGHFFFMGDNRDNSFDSRYAQSTGGVGFAAADSLIGRVSRVVFSSEGAMLGDVSHWRPDRYWKVVE